LKSNESDFLELVEVVYIDASTKCTADVFDFRDLKTIRSRIENEGLSFLTITLPQFCKSFERSLANGYVDSTAFPGFKRVRAGSIPEFLQGMTSQVFDVKTGEVIRDVPLQNRGVASDISTVVESVRQICLTFKKVEMDCTPERVSASLDNFVSIEQDFDNFQPSEEETAKFLAVSSVLWDNMVSDFVASSIVPKHGPGATAEHKSGNQKYVWKFWHDRLEPYFPLVDTGYPLGIPEDAKEFGIVTIVPETEEQPVRVVQVSKTLKSPRIIAIEPCCMQYVQQGIRSYLYDKIESYWLTGGHINFRDQSVNQRLAIKSSRTGRLATIDLSDASDRVPRDLALAMFRANPELQDSIDACRSKAAQLPDGRLVPTLRKFASMGSALCFPVEAMYFYTICVMALLDARNLSYTPRNVYLVTRRLYVYGDDIIVPSTNADGIVDYLRKYNCKVNASKSFWNGNFRESCGVDAYMGKLVTPVYLRQLRPNNTRQAENIVSWVATANLFYKKGYWRTSSYMFNILEDLVGDLPYVTDTSSALGRISFLGFQSVERWNEDLQRFEIRALTPKPVERTDHLEGYGAIMKYFLNPVEDLWRASKPELVRTINAVGELTYKPFRKGWTYGLLPLPASDKYRMERSARHAAVALTRRWVPAH